MMGTPSELNPPAVARGWKKEALDFLVSDREALPMRVFECLFTAAFLCCLGHSLVSWQEWLTVEGIHLNAEEMKSLRYPEPWPILVPWQVGVFVGLVLIGAIGVLWPRGCGGKIADFMVRPAVQKMSYRILFLCALYAQRADYVAATMASRLFVAVYAILAFSPPQLRHPGTGRLIQSAVPMRVLQATLIIQYFSSGLAKMDADWLTSANVLWSHVQGLHRTDLAAYALRVLPKWAWTAQQNVALLFEVGAPLFFTIRFFRPFAVVVGVTFHLMIALMMQDLILYGFVMWSFYALFLPASFWCWSARLFNREKENSAGSELSAATIQAENAKETGQIWWTKLGGWQADLLSRCFGFLLYLNLLCHLLKRTLGEFLESYPVSTLYLGICGLALLFVGPRVILFILALLSGIDFFLKVLYGEGGPGLHQQAAEYPIFLLIPFALLLLSISLRRRVWRSKEILPENRWSVFHQCFEKQCVMIFRWTAVMTMFFVSFHKINADFFNLSTSCEAAVKVFLGKNWKFEWLQTAASISSPTLVVFLEGLIPIVLLLTFRRIGILAAACIYGTIAFCDALTITLCVILPALAFLNDADLKLIQLHKKALTFVWLGLLAVWLPFSCGSYLAFRPWIQAGLYQTVVLAVIVAVAGIQIISMIESQRNGDSISISDRIGFNFASLVPSCDAGNQVVCLIVALLLFNGFCPYLGLKFNYSFAMLSNLRTDDARWNHLLVPKWVRLTKHDGFFHVHEAKVKYGSSDDAKLKGEVRLKPGLFAPQSFHDEMKRLRDLKGSVELALLLEYQGRAYDYQGMVDDLKFAVFLDALPQPHGRWLHDYLAAEGPQGCKH